MQEKAKAKADFNTPLLSKSKACAIISPLKRQKTSFHPLSKTTTTTSTNTSSTTTTKPGYTFLTSATSPISSSNNNVFQNKKTSCSTLFEDSYMKKEFPKVSTTTAAANTSYASSSTNEGGLANWIKYLTSNVRGDMIGGLTAAVVTLPQALAFGVATGVGALAGVYGAIFCGFFAALFGGTPAQVSGPTGPMSVVTAAILSKHPSNPGVLFATIVLAGLFQIVIGILRIGRYIRLVPAPVTVGFMSGIGFIILFTQVLPLCGLPGTASPLKAIKMYPQIMSTLNVQALICGLISAACCWFTPKKVSQYIPGSLLALFLGTSVSLVFGFDVKTLGAIPMQVPKPMKLIFASEFLPDIIKNAVVLSLLGGIDSLLTSLVCDNITNTYHDSDKEMIGQGIGNTFSGFFGGIPGAGATMLSVVNVKAGGRTPLSGAFEAFVILAVVLGLGSVAKNVPLAVLAGILMKSGLDIIDIKFIKRIPQLPVSSAAVMIVVLLATVFIDLILAVAAGCILASLLLVKQLADTQIDQCSIIAPDGVSSTNCGDLNPIETSMVQKSNGRLGVIQMNGSFTFSAANGMLRKVIPAVDALEATVLDLSSVSLVDGDATLAIEDLVVRALSNDKIFLICGAFPSTIAMMNKIGLTEILDLPPSSTRQECIEYALEKIGPGGSTISETVLAYDAN